MFNKLLNAVFDDIVRPISLCCTMTPLNSCYSRLKDLKGQA